MFEGQSIIFKQYIYLYNISYIKVGVNKTYVVIKTFSN